MTAIALIAPGAIAQRFCAGRPFQMALAGELAHGQETAYSQFYTVRNHRPGQYWIMDNGAWEAERVPADMLFGLAVGYVMDEVVAPDIINDPDATYKATYDYLDMLSTTMHPNVAVVAHGQTLAEAQEFIYRIDELKDIRVTTIMIGRAFSRQLGNPTARYTLANWIKNTFGQRYDIHLLGFNDDWGVEELVCCRDITRSMDTAMPFIETLYGIDLNDPRHRRERRPRQGDFFFSPAERFDEQLLQHNIQVLDMWAGA